MSQLPMPFRAALGLAATALDEARRLPDRAVELPMLAVGTALQLSMRAQQHYAALVARGDDLISTRSVTDEPPEWASFDDDPVEAATDARFDDAQVDRDPAPGTAAPGNAVHHPRHTEPSRFDVVDDD